MRVYSLLGLGRGLGVGGRGRTRFEGDRRTSGATIKFKPSRTAVSDCVREGTGYVPIFFPAILFFPALL